MRTYSKSLIFSLLAISFLISCNDDDDTKAPVETPTTYSFERNGQSSVAYTGQTNRLDQLAAIKAYLVKGDKKEEVLDAQRLKDMYANTDGNGAGNFSFSAPGKQLKDKTFLADVAYYEELFEEAEAASSVGADASEGVAGFLPRGESTILVNKNGHEFTQVIEKGLMGSVLFHQIFNAYLTDSKIGDDIENNNVDGSNNYTLMEHHWDEAFGYYGVPVDFPTNKTGARFWGSYSNQRDGLLKNGERGVNTVLMDAFKRGRAAIVAKRYDVKKEQRDIIYENLELIAASTAIHYLNEAKKFFAQVDTKRGDAFHVTSEAYAFVRALRLSPKKKITDAQINTILNENIGENFWAIEETDLSGLNAAINTLVTVYPSLAPIKDQL